MTTPQQQRILVIKLSSLGDIVLSLGSIRAIRDHHRAARITLLTTRAYVRLAEACGCFDEVWVDERPRPWQAAAWLRLVRRLRGVGFARVYDLQGSQRTGWYFRLLGRRAREWVGTTAGCSHRYIGPPEPIHVTDYHAGMLALGGITDVPPPDVSFLTADVARYAIAGPYGLLAPGSSANRPGKRWPIQQYAELANALAEKGMKPVLICGPDEREVARLIAEACPAAYDIESDFNDIVALARGARIAVGNDTGPIHLIAAAGCPTVALFGPESHPVKSKPPGKSVVVLHRPSLADLTVAEVMTVVGEIAR